MSERKKSKILNYELPFFYVALIASVLFMANMVLLERDLKSRNVLGVSSKGSSGNISKEEKENPNAGGKSDDNITGMVKDSGHTLKVKEIVTGLEDVALEEEVTGDTEVAGELKDVAGEIENMAVKAAESIDELENRPAWKTFLVGTDYENLGQLRSALVQTDNSIRKITQTMARVEGEDSDLALQQRLGELNQERNRIVQIIREEEQKFSLFGWLLKLVNGYTGDVSDVVTGNTTEATESLQ